MTAWSRPRVAPCAPAWSRWRPLGAAVLLWPEPEHPLTLPRLGAALQDLAARLARAATGVVERREPGAAGTRIRTSVDALADRPASPTGAQRAELYLVNDIERLDCLVSRLEQTPEPSDDEVALLLRCASDLSRCGRALSDARAVAHSALPTVPKPARAPFSLAARLAAVTSTIASHTRATLGHSPEGTVVDAFTTEPWTGGGRSDVLHAARRLRANATLRSVHVHDALRVGAGLALASGAVSVIGLQHGFWVAFAALTVIKSNVRASVASWTRGVGPDRQSPALGRSMAMQGPLSARGGWAKVSLSR